uniref:Uncharacterized protein n=1 Tax=Oryza sativa subsp. japonica TaxID=39947 RepID=Q69QF4_ORYSJ|nr:hypothetical protein [Oryza sativa Japonica Group]
MCDYMCCQVKIKVLFQGEKTPGEGLAPSLCRRIVVVVEEEAGGLAPSSRRRCLRVVGTVVVEEEVGGEEGAGGGGGADGEEGNWRRRQGGGEPVDPSLHGAAKVVVVVAKGSRQLAEAASRSSSSSLRREPAAEARMRATSGGGGKEGSRWIRRFTAPQRSSSSRPRGADGSWRRHHGRCRRRGGEPVDPKLHGATKVVVLRPRGADGERRQRRGGPQYVPPAKIIFFQADNLRGGHLAPRVIPAWKNKRPNITSTQASTVTTSIAVKVIAVVTKLQSASPSLSQPQTLDIVTTEGQHGQACVWSRCAAAIKGRRRS